MSRLQSLRGGGRHASRSAYTSGTSTPVPSFGPPVISSMHSAVKDSTGKTTEYRNEEDVCPVCKSDRFLNPKLRLLVSSCYHRMCESCIDRLFTLGPAPCPICQKTLRKMAFIPQTFEDLIVEKEVGVRRRIAKEFNKRREDFPDLRTYNDYLEEVEDITFNLINGIDVDATEARIAAYRLENAALIELNIQREERDHVGLAEEEARERRERELRAEEERLLEEEQRLEREREKQDIINKLESSSDSAFRLVAKSRAEASKRAQTRKPKTTSALHPHSRLSSTAGTTTLAKDEPHTALQDDWYSYDDKFIVRSSYVDPVSDFFRQDADHRVQAGGYRIEEIWERALRSAVMGLDIQPLGQEDGSSGSEAISLEPRDVVMRDVDVSLS